MPSIVGGASGGAPSLLNFREALKLLRDGHTDGMTVGLAISFITVALYPGRSLREYQELQGRSQSSMSRHLLDLGELNRKREPGPKLIEQHPDITDRRKNVYRLSPKGRLLVAALERALSGQATPAGGGGTNA